MENSFKPPLEAVVAFEYLKMKIDITIRETEETAKYWHRITPSIGGKMREGVRAVHAKLVKVRMAADEALAAKSEVELIDAAGKLSTAMAVATSAMDAWESLSARALP